MVKLRRPVSQIATNPPSQRLSALSPLQLALIPLLSFASAVYSLSLFLRHRLYRLGIVHKYRLPVPVISVGNLTWGGNGKTPMVKFIARWVLDSGISPLIPTRVGGAFGGNRGVRPVPPEKGVFPLDHMHLCDQEKKEYLNCLKSSGHKSEKCRHLSKLYLQCRMEKNLMAKQDMSELGFGRESDAEALPDRSKMGGIDD